MAIVRRDIDIVGATGGGKDINKLCSPEIGPMTAVVRLTHLK